MAASWFGFISQANRKVQLQGPLFQAQAKILDYRGGVLFLNYVEGRKIQMTMYICLALNSNRPTTRLQFSLRFIRDSGIFCSAWKCFFALKPI